MEIAVASVRGMGASIAPMLISILGVCGFRILWVYTVFRAVGTLEMLYISYPVSWVGTFLAQLIGYAIVRRRLPQHIPQ